MCQEQKGRLHFSASDEIEADTLHIITKQPLQCQLEVTLMRVVKARPPFIAHACTLVLAYSAKTLLP